jgi:TonB family protein
MDAAAPEVTIAPPEAQPSGLNHLGKVNSPAVPLPASAAGSQPPQPASSNLVLPKLKSSVAPVYPMEARRNSIAGDVVLDTLITEKGKVTDVKVVSGPVLLRQAAISAVQMWVYEPARLNGKPTAMRLNVTIKFLR